MPLNDKIDQEIESFEHETRLSVGNEREVRFTSRPNSAVPDQWNDRVGKKRAEFGRKRPVFEDCRDTVTSGDDKGFLVTFS